MTPAAGAARCQDSLVSFLLHRFGGVTLPRGVSPQLYLVINRQSSQNCVLMSTHQLARKVCSVMGAEAPRGSRHVTHRPGPALRHSLSPAEAKERCPLAGLSASRVLLAGGSSVSPHWIVWKHIPSPQIPLSANPQDQSQLR